MLRYQLATALIIGACDGYFTYVVVTDLDDAHGRKSEKSSFIENGELIKSRLPSNNDSGRRF